MEEQIASSNSNFLQDPAYPLCSSSNENETSLNNLTFVSSSSSVFCNNSLGVYPWTVVRDDVDENIELQRIVQIIVPILFGIIFIVGLFGNALVVIVVASNAQMRNTTNLLIINLAIADLLFIIFCVPFTATDYVLSYWPFGVLWCKMVQYLIIVTAYASVLTLVLMSVDRFLAVVYPVQSISIRNEQNALLAIGITWIVILVTCSPAFLAHGLETQTYDYQHFLVCTFKRATYNHVAFQIIFMLTSYAIPLTIICLLYFGMLFRLWKSVSGSGASRNSLRGKKRVTRMVVIVVAVFAICWLPIQVVLVLKSLDLYDMTDITVAIQITAHVLGYMNSCVNPILYAFLSENFRKAFRKVIRCSGTATGGSGYGLKWLNFFGCIGRGGNCHAMNHYKHQIIDNNEAHIYPMNETSFLTTAHYENGSPRINLLKGSFKNLDIL